MDCTFENIDIIRLFNSLRPELNSQEGFDLESVDDALNSCVNIFNLYSRFLAYFSPNWLIKPHFTLLFLFL